MVCLILREGLSILVFPCAADLEEEEDEEEAEEPSQYHTPTAGRNASRNTSNTDADTTLNRSTPREKTKSPAAHVSFNMADVSLASFITQI